MELPTPESDEKQHAMASLREAVESGRQDAGPEEQGVSSLAVLRSALQLHGKEVKLNVEQNQQVENVLRLLLQEYVEAAVSAGQPVMHYGAPVESSAGGEGAPKGCVPRLLDLVLGLCDAGHVEGGLVLLLLEDLLEECVIDDCKEVFDYIEAKQHLLAKEHILQRGKLILLRACNQLVRRLSKANDLIFCGRILMFLAFLFPIAEKSAVNFKGAFNTANKTTFSTGPPTEGTLHFDFHFYTTFWSLQEYFSNPPSASAQWPAFSSSLKAVLNAFSAQPLAESGAAEAAAVAGDLGTFNVKYLTSSNLLGLQLKDHNFRRHVLLQCLMLLDYLQLPTAPSKHQDSGSAKERDAKRAAVLAEIKELQDAVRNLLGSIEPGGAEFLQAVDHILGREKNWISWKKEGCPSFERPAAPFASGASREGTAVGAAPKTPHPKKQRSMLGNKELDQLFSWAARNPGVLTDPEAVAVPRLRDFVQPLADDMDPRSGVEEELHRRHDKVFCWRALRLAARQDIDAFQKFSDLGIEGLVPADMLPEEVRQKLPGKQQAPSPASRPKREAVADATARRSAAPESAKVTSPPPLPKPAVASAEESGKLDIKPPRKESVEAAPGGGAPAPQPSERGPTAQQSAPAEGDQADGDCGPATAAGGSEPVQLGGEADRGGVATASAEALPLAAAAAKSAPAKKRPRAEEP